MNKKGNNPQTVKLSILLFKKAERMTNRTIERKKQYNTITKYFSFI